LVRASGDMLKLRSQGVIEDIGLDTGISAEEAASLRTAAALRPSSQSDDSVSVQGILAKSVTDATSQAAAPNGIMTNAGTAPCQGSCILDSMHDSEKLRSTIARTFYRTRMSSGTNRVLLQHPAQLSNIDDEAPTSLFSSNLGEEEVNPTSACCACAATGTATSGNSTSDRNVTEASTNASTYTSLSMTSEDEIDLLDLLGEGNASANASDANGTASATGACCACHDAKQITLTFDMNQPSDAASLAAFQTSFKTEVASGLNIDPSMIEFHSATPTEVENSEDLGETSTANKYTVSFTLSSGATNTNTSALVKTLATQVSMPTSPLSMGQIMSQLDKSAGMAVGTVAAGATSCEAVASKWNYLDPPAAPGPANWKTTYPKCGSQNQSPIRLPLVPPKKSGTVFSRLDFDYKLSPATLMNDGRTLMAMVQPGSTFRVSGDDSSEAILQYAVFHSPSEHVFTDANGNDIRYAAEIQLHHRSSDGRIVVVSVLFKVNAPSPFIDKLFSKVPSKCQSSTTEQSIKFEDVLPFSRTYYMYEGSLTSPPCTDSTKWYVLRAQSTISLQQLEKLRETLRLDIKKPEPIDASQDATLGSHEIQILDKDQYPDYEFSKTLMGNVRPLQDLGDRKLWATPADM